MVPTGMIKMNDNRSHQSRVLQLRDTEGSIVSNYEGCIVLFCIT